MPSVASTRVWADDGGSLFRDGMAWDWEGEGGLRSLSVSFAACAALPPRNPRRRRPFFFCDIQKAKEVTREGE